jgi:serine/threonine protein kinase
MSFAPGESLDCLGTLSPEAACRIGAKVLRALAYLHKGGIVHGDVKPKNVVVESLEPGGSVVLVDLGLAAVRPIATSKPLGWSEGYAAPEVVSGAPPLPESDLYSLGKTLEASLGEQAIPLPLRELIEALIDPKPARRPRWETKDPLRWLERVRRVLTRRKEP